MSSLPFSPAKQRLSSFSSQLFFTKTSCLVQLKQFASMKVLPEYFIKKVPPKPNVFIFCYSRQHFVNKFTSLPLNFKTGKLKPLIFSCFLIFFLIRLDETRQVCLIRFATSSKDSVSHSYVPLQGESIVVSSG